MIRPTRGGLNRTSGAITTRSGSRAVILVYHRVDDALSDPWGLAVTPWHFASHMDALQQTMRPTSLVDLADAVRDDAVPPRGVVVTFDDGYADNLHYAKPALERCRIPATVFIATGYTGDPREFWWDALQRALLTPGALPARLCVTIDGDEHTWEFDDLDDSDARSGDRYRHWRAWEPPPTSRHSAYLALWQLLRPLPEDRRCRLLDEIVEWAGVRGDASASADAVEARPMSAAELSRLVAGDLVEVGAHTVTHPLLAALPPASQRHEIADSKASLEKLLARPIPGFAYPFGSFDDRTVAIVREAGFACACAASPGYIDRTSDTFRLPRVPVSDCPAPALIEQLTAILEG
jgi:peptidoglycan/xylan/chitin deacetylase (PgdA/CDA1 family)